MSGSSMPGDLAARLRCRHLLPQVSEQCHAILIREGSHELTDEQRAFVEAEIEELYRVRLRAFRDAVARDWNAGGNVASS